MWTRLEGTELWEAARAAHETPAGRKYHVFDHPLRLYEIAETLGVPYDEALDKAILCHDVVYEGREDDVLRSAEFLLKHDPSATKAAALIMTTEHHTPSADNRLVLLDLHDLNDSRLRASNRELIAEEMANLKGASRDAFNAGNAAFMTALRSRIVEGVRSTNVPRNDLDGFSRIIHSIDEMLAPEPVGFSLT